jgi:hypothetical protein
VGAKTAYQNVLIASVLHVRCETKSKLSVEAQNTHTVLIGLFITNLRDLIELLTHRHDLAVPRPPRTAAA